MKIGRLLGKILNIGVMENNLELFLVVDFEFEVLDDVLFNMFFLDYFINGIDNFFRFVFNNCVINFV